jgi:hypothetical protein
MLKTILYSILFIVGASSVLAHELTPTYFKPKSSLYKNVQLVEMMLFNRREDVRFYEITAFDENWKPMKFATISKIIEVKYLEKKPIEVYFRDEDINKLTYICTRSLILKNEVKSTGISSRICSKMK